MLNLDLIRATPRRRRRSLAGMGVSALLLLAAGAAHAGEFLPLPYLPGGERSNSSFTISNDGTAVVGTCLTRLPDRTRAGHGCLWTEGNGWSARSIGEVFTNRGPQDVSNHLPHLGGTQQGGYVVVGSRAIPQTGEHVAIVWDSVSDTMQDLRDLHPQLALLGPSAATGVSEDGTVIVGNGDSGVNVGPIEPFRYDRLSETVDSGLRYILQLADPVLCEFFGIACEEYVPVRASSVGWGVSRDGNIVTGGVDDSYSARPALIDFDHPEGLIEQLSSTYGGGYNINAAGDVAVGILGFGGGADKGFAWSRDGGFRILYDVGTGGSAHAKALNGDGSLIGGYANVSGNRRASLWNVAPDTPDSVFARPAAGVFINDYGVDPAELAGWDLREVTGISEDGNRVTGFGKNPQNEWQAWLVVRTECQVDAGTNQSVSEGATVMLSGSASTSPKTLFGYEWNQVAGPGVVLDYPFAASTLFDAPFVDDNTTLTFELIATSGNSEIECPIDSVDVSIINSNNPPVADAGDSFEIGEGARARLDGTASYDPDGEPITFEWVQILNGGPVVMLEDRNGAAPEFDVPVGFGGDLRFRLTVSDAEGPGSSDEVTVTVVENAAPVADAGTPQTVEEGSTVMLDGSGSADPDGDAITYAWSGPVGLSDPNAAAPTFVAPPVAAGGATFTFALTVSDDHPYNPKSDMDSVEVTVQNVNDPPDCSLAVARCDDSTIRSHDTCLIWPPNHRMLGMTIGGVADPNDDEVVVAITGITQDEPVDGLGDGNTSPDGVIQPGGTALIRAERSGTGNGRVYAIAFTASDGQGGACTGTVTAAVPHDRKSVPVDDGQVFDSTLP